MAIENFSSSFQHLIVAKKRLHTKAYQCEIEKYFLISRKFAKDKEVSLFREGPGQQITTFVQTHFSNR